MTTPHAGILTARSGSETKRRGPTLLEAAELSGACYSEQADVTLDVDRRQVQQQACSVHDRQVIWRRSRRWSAASFYAALYTTDSGGRVLAFRGTDGLADVLLDDAAIGFGGVPATALAAVQLPAAAGTQGLLLTGHSLGGALAIIAAARYGLPAVTFNAPGVMDSCVLAARLPGPRSGLGSFLATVGRCVSGGRMLNIRITADPVSSLFTTGLQSGRRVELGATQCGLNALCRHGIHACIAALRQRSDAYDEVKL